MSKASRFGVAVIERRFGPVIPDGLDYEDSVTMFGDQVAYWMHWLAAKVIEECEDLDVDSEIQRGIEGALYHFEAEHGEGDDIADDPSYDDMLAGLP